MKRLIWAAILTLVPASVGYGQNVDPEMPEWLLGTWCPFIDHEPNEPPFRVDDRVEETADGMIVSPNYQDLGAQCHDWWMEDDGSLMSEEVFALSGLPSPYSRDRIWSRQGGLNYESTHGGGGLFREKPKTDGPYRVTIIGPSEFVILHKDREDVFLRYSLQEDRLTVEAFPKDGSETVRTVYLRRDRRSP